MPSEVIVYKWELNNSENTRQRVESHRALLLEFGMEAIDDEAYTVGIVSDSNGGIDAIPVNLLQFVNPPYTSFFSEDPKEDE
jgi:hypothetical protein